MLRLIVMTKNKDCLGTEVRNGISRNAPQVVFRPFFIQQIAFSALMEFAEFVICYICSTVELGRLGKHEQLQTYFSLTCILPGLCSTSCFPLNFGYLACCLRGEASLNGTSTHKLPFKGTAGGPSLQQGWKSGNRQQHQFPFLVQQRI